jgi:putative hydrolase of the HAD superfamily
MKNSPKKYRAVIFDLFGTLCRYSHEKDLESARQVAETCAAPIEKFVELFVYHSANLGTGKYKTWPDYISFICGLMKIDTPHQLLQAAAEIQVTDTRNQICDVHEGAVELLDYLKCNGYKLGVISDCFYDVPEAWPETPYAPFFDVTIFSCEVGMNKANPAIFKIALEKLKVKAEDCIYIADGMRHELTNAAGLGVTSVHICIP